MKKTFIILGALCVLLVAALTAMAFWLQGEFETERNRSRTAAASKARWSLDKDPEPERKVDPNGVTENEKITS